MGRPGSSWGADRHSATQAARVDVEPENVTQTKPGAQGLLPEQGAHPSEHTSMIPAQVAPPTWMSRPAGPARGAVRETPQTDMRCEGATEEGYTAVACRGAAACSCACRAARSWGGAALGGLAPSQDAWAWSAACSCKERPRADPCRDRRVSSSSCCKVHA